MIQDSTQTTIAVITDEPRNPSKATVTTNITRSTTIPQVGGHQAAATLLVSSSPPSTISSYYSTSSTTSYSTSSTSSPLSCGSGGGTQRRESVECCAREYYAMQAMISASMLHRHRHLQQSRSLSSSSRKRKASPSHCNYYTLTPLGKKALGELRVSELKKELPESLAAAAQVQMPGGGRRWYMSRLIEQRLPRGCGGAQGYSRKQKLKSAWASHIGPSITLGVAAWPSASTTTSMMVPKMSGGLPIISATPAAVTAD